MIPSESIAAVVRRDRAILLVTLAAVSGLAWVYMMQMASEATAGAGCHTMMAPTVRPWSARDFAAAAAMWAAMMAAMMLPIVSPWLLALLRSARQRDARLAPISETVGFLVGYGTVWLVYSVVAAAGQLLLQRAALVSGQWAVTNPALGVGLLVAAGIYQWTPLRDACMSHCRSPIGFFLSSWREGSWGAFTMGLRHGIYCVGCCWALMALSFVFGVMNVMWMALATGFLLVEKATSAGPWMTKPAGVLLAGWGIWVMLGR